MNVFFWGFFIFLFDKMAKIFLFFYFVISVLIFWWGLDMQFWIGKYLYKIYNWMTLIFFSKKFITRLEIEFTGTLMAIKVTLCVRNRLSWTSFWMTIPFRVLFLHLDRIACLFLRLAFGVPAPVQRQHRPARKNRRQSLEGLPEFFHSLFNFGLCFRSWDIQLEKKAIERPTRWIKSQSLDRG